MVRDPAAVAIGWCISIIRGWGTASCPGCYSLRVRGAKGNQEYFVHLVMAGGAVQPPAYGELVRAAVRRPSDEAALQLHPTRVTDELLEQRVYPVLDELGCQYYALPRRHAGRRGHRAGTDLILVLGGDGTFLYGARLAVAAWPADPGRDGRPRGFPVQRRAGRAGGVRCEPSSGHDADRGAVSRCTAPIVGAEGVRSEQIAINDVVLFRTGMEKIRDFTAHDNGKLIARYRADGIILASATGSTAYTMAAGGPLVHPSLDVIVMTPVCAHSMFTKPLVLPPDHGVEITARSESYPMTVSFDGAYLHQLHRATG